MEIVEEILRLFAERGQQAYLGEAVTQEEHALQSATLAEAAGLSSNEIVAALLHDIGHFLAAADEPSQSPSSADDHHEAVGYAWLQRHFGPAVADPVRLHVDAKRYLCATEPEYVSTLSATSLQSLHDQGGPMSAGELGQFESEPLFQAAVTLRRFDDAAKVPRTATPNLEHFRQYVETALRDGSRE